MLELVEEPELIVANVTANQSSLCEVDKHIFRRNKGEKVLVMCIVFFKAFLI